MQESDTYQAILEEGAVGQLRRMVLKFGQIRFGPASDDVVAAAQGIDNLERLERLFYSHYELSSWRDLLQVP